MQNTITLGATLLSNSTESYASFAVLMDQSVGRAVSLILSYMDMIMLLSKENLPS